MKVRALVQAEHWLDRAGVRIRYRRIASRLQSLGARLEVDVIDSIDHATPINDDVVILSKCTDARAMVAARILREQGVIVGVDLFDDYFSNPLGPCHVHREFLREMVNHVDFILCSTDRMADVGRSFAPNMPIHVLNDPFDVFAPDALAVRLEQKVERARAERRIDVVWFGTGSNPIFPVGLTDLAAFAPALQPFIGSAYQVRMKVLTDLRALDSANLARLRSVPLPLTIEEWSEEGEAAARDEALISFLPVNYQNFSIAKSLNRGISALSGGTQILSAGYDLYRPIVDFVYRNANDLLRDLDAGQMLLRPETLPALRACMDHLADPGNEAARLLAFLQGLQPIRSKGAHLLRAGASARHAVIHGRRSPSAVHIFGRDRDVLSIGSVLANPSRECDLHFRISPATGLFEVCVGKNGDKFLSADLQQYLNPVASGGSRYPHVLELPHDEQLEEMRQLAYAMMRSRPLQTVHYARMMDLTEAVSQRFMPGIRILRSDREMPLVGVVHLEQAVIAARESRA